MNSSLATDPKKVKAHFVGLKDRFAGYRKVLGRSLTLAEKILFSHLSKDADVSKLVRGKSFLMLKPDRVAMQDATAQMAILQFLQSQKTQVAAPTTVHCDHLIRAHLGSKKDIETATTENSEVYNFLKSASQKLGLGFWGPGAGIIHQVVFENYAFPGGLMIGTDSHTPNAGGLGMLAIGVGGADAVDVMAGLDWELLNPKIIAVHLKGKLRGWTAPKDVILKVLEILTVKGGTNKIVEYIGEGAESLSCTGKGTITNMGAELGATTSVFAYDEAMGVYLRATNRSDIADLCDQYREHLQPDPEVFSDLKKYYDEVYEIDLDKLEPYIVGPHTPDLARPISKLASEVKEKGYPDEISATLIGSCTNSSYQDIYRAASIAEQALKLGLKAKMPFFVSPGSMQIYATVKRDGLLDTLEKFGATVLANACGPCIGQWKRDGMKEGQANSIVTSFNRNFRGRNDSNDATLGFIGSPEMVMAYAVGGHLSFNPVHDKVKASDGREVLLTLPEGPQLPSKGFVMDHSGFIEPPQDRSKVKVEVDPKSKRLELLSPFPAWNGKDFVDQLLLVKVKGKCTTDHISPAGKWLQFRGHLTNISDNMLLGAQNAFYDKPGQGLNQLTQKRGETLSAIARDYKKAGHGWVIVADENYGEGSSREHAAMSPRYLGASTVLVKSFARIHETNLKKQGILALTFADPKDWDRIGEEDKISVLGLNSFQPGKQLTVRVTPKTGKSFEVQANHSYNAEQIKWFKAGSSLNLIN